MSKNPSGSILIFDIEGTDSKERGEQRLVKHLFINTSLDFWINNIIICISCSWCPYDQYVDDSTNFNLFVILI